MSIIPKEYRSIPDLTEKQMAELTQDRWPKTVGDAWDRLLCELEHQGVCFKIEGDFCPERNGTNYGQLIHQTVERLQDTGRWTIDQVMAVRDLCRVVALTAKG
jgi:hypothetical protein